MMQLSFRSRLLIGGALTLVAGGALILLVLAVAGGDDDDTIRVSDLSEISCDPLAENSYRYHVEAVQAYGDVDPEAPQETAPPLGFAVWSFSERHDGEIEDGGDLYVFMFNSDGGNMGEFQLIDMGETGYIKYVGRPWQKADTTVRPLPVRHRPALVCEALAPDVDLSALDTGNPEDVNGIASYRYDIDGEKLGFLARSREFGTGSDIGAYADEYTGSIWIAEEGGYPSRIDLLVSGHYPDGRRISLDFLFEISDMGDDLKVEPPDIE